MAASHSFRTALSGFNREDVVHYIEYLNSKHTSQVNQLTSENEELRARLEQLSSVSQDADRGAELETMLEQANAELDTLKASLSAAEAERDATLAEAEKWKAQLAEQAGRNLAEPELESYRRAERAERDAKERAKQIYQQATGTLAQATSQVDNAAEQFRRAADRINSQMSELQAAVELSKSALVDAATTMYTIRPEDTEE